MQLSPTSPTLASPFSVMVEQPISTGHGGVRMAQIQHDPALTDAWLGSTLDNSKGPISGWNSGAIDAAAGAALQRRVEAFVAAHPPHQPSDQVGAPAPSLTVIDGSTTAVYAAASGDAKHLLDAVFALAAAAPASAARA